MGWVTIYTTNQLVEANLVKGLLKSENIEVCLLNKQDSSYTIFGQIELLVPQAFYHQSLQLLKQQDIIK
ncbi:MAG: DUF2007 domain-containing protein [Bacteroidia bacterium]|nr:DUF2007 domain-containing protein [Bacteroidia bacterium]